MNQPQTTAYNLVVVVLRKSDYVTMRRSGVPESHQISLALRYYLHLIAETKLVPGNPNPAIFHEKITTLRCGLPRDLCASLRRLGGRLDLHVMEAVRLWLL